MTYTTQLRQTRGLSRALALSSIIAETALPLTAFAASGQKISARAHGERVSVTVPMEVLSTEDGAARIYQALERKAKRSCKITIPQRLGRSVPIGSCSRDLMDDFVKALDHEGLTALHTAES
jgi:UrcA family protein